MAKETRIRLTHLRHVRISWEKLAEIYGMSVTAYRKQFNKLPFDYRPFSEGIECPFGERDLMNDTCYLGRGVHQCPYFVRYEHSSGTSTIVCRCPKPKKAIQLSLF